MLGKKLKQKAFIVALHLTVTAYILIYTCNILTVKVWILWRFGLSCVLLWIRYLIIRLQMMITATANKDIVTPRAIVESGLSVKQHSYFVFQRFKEIIF